MKKERWGSPKWVELNIWIRVPRRNEDRLYKDKIDDLAKMFPNFLESTA